MFGQKVIKDFKNYQLIIRNLRNEYDKSNCKKTSNTIRKGKKG